MLTSLLNYSRRFNSVAVLRLLSKKEKSQYFVLILVLVVNAILETLTLGLIVPVTSTLSNTDSSNFLTKFLLHIGFKDRDQLVVGIVFIFCFAYVVKSLMSLAGLWFQRRFCAKVERRLGADLFEFYVRQPYEFFVRTNSSLLIRNTSNATLVTGSTLEPFLIFSAEASIALAIVFFMIYSQPLATIIVGLFVTTLIFGFHRLTRQRLSKYGEVKNQNEQERVQLMMETYSGIKDVKILGRENYFVSRYRSNSFSIADSSKKYQFIQGMPRTILETCAVMGMAVTVLVVTKQNDSSADVLPVIALFSMAAFRLMPSANRLLNCFQAMRFHSSMVEDVIQQFELVGRSEQEPQVSTNNSLVPSSIELRNLTFYYHGSDTPSLNNINLKVQAGSSIAISGPSGSGKTTLVNVILGLLSPSEGSIFLDGIDVTKQTERWKGQIGYVPQDIFLTDDTIRNNIAFGIESDQIDEISVNRAVELSHVSHFIEQLPDGLNTLVGERGIRLSGGQRQRIGIARALYTNPSIIIFDEATSALDSETESAVVEAINSLQLGRTLFVIAHRESTLRHCNIAITMNNGRLVSNSVGN